MSQTFRRLRGRPRPAPPLLCRAIAREQSDKALLPKQVALPGRGSVTGEVTPKHSQFIACRQGKGVGVGARGSRRAAEGSEEAAGDKDGTVLLSSYHHSFLEGFTHLQEPFAFDGRRRASAQRGRQGSRGHPHPASAGGHREPDLRRGTVPSPGMLAWGLRRKPVPQSRAGDERTPRSARQRRRLVIWSVNIGGGVGDGEEGQWQRIYIKIKGEEGRNSERERARSWLRSETVTFR